MEIFNISDISEIKKDNIKRVAALGFFDCIHKKLIFYFEIFTKI